MRLSEAITIYLAAGAPFGFHYFLRRRRAGRLHTLSRAARAALLWPLAAAKILFTRQGPDEGGPAAARLGEMACGAQGQLLSSLYRLAELAQSSPGAEANGVERAVRVTREAVEKYVGLSLAAAELDLDGQPSGRELELYRVAGRRGPDLLLAGRCARRRSAARLFKHHARSRAELLRALAGIRGSPGAQPAPTDAAAALHLSVALVRLYGCALNLLSLFEDEAAGGGVSRLLDAECARLRRLEASREERATKEETCTPHTTREAFHRGQQTRTSNRG